MDLQVQLQQQLQKLIIPKTKLIVEKAVSPEDSFLNSHFKGTPYFEEGEEWPVNTKTGKPLEFVFQIVNDGSLPLHPEIQLIQFYCDIYGDEFIVNGSQSYGYEVKIYTQPASHTYRYVERPADFFARDYYSITFKVKDSLPDWDSLEFEDSSGTIQSLCERINPRNPSRIFREVSKELVREQRMESGIGGYPQWIQGPAYAGIFFMQIDSEANFMWGDSGLLYFFYDSDSPNGITFEMQSC